MYYTWVRNSHNGWHEWYLNLCGLLISFYYFSMKLDFQPVGNKMGQKNLSTVNKGGTQANSKDRIMKQWPHAFPAAVVSEVFLL